MTRIARSTFMFGSALLLGGAIWIALIFKGGASIWPAVLDKPLTAFTVVALGILLIFLGRRFGSPRHAAEDHVALEAPRDETARGLKPRDFRDMLQDISVLRAPGTAKPAVPAEPLALPQPEPEPLPEPEEDPEIVAKRLPSAEEAEGPVSIAMAAFARMQQEPAPEPEPELPPRVEPSVRLATAFHIMLPAQPAESWIGGAPRMPQSMQWPELGGQPGLFVAQIALSDLAPELWGGHGPRTGWLAFFTGATPNDGISVLHIKDPAPHRAAPEGTPLPYDARSACARLAHLTGQAARTAPRLMLEPSQYGSVTPDTAGSGLADFLQRATLDDSAVYPFDWTSAQALLDALTSALRRDLKLWEQNGAATLTPEAAAAAREARLLTLARLRLITKHTESRIAQVAFDESEADDLLSALADLDTEGWTPGQRSETILSMAYFRGYRALLEAHARERAAAGDETLPKPLLRALSPVWQVEAAHPVVTFGGPETETSVTLAEFRAGPLSGWPKALRRPLRVVMPRRALQAGAFETARLVQPRVTNTDPTE